MSPIYLRIVQALILITFLKSIASINEYMSKRGNKNLDLTIKTIFGILLFSSLIFVFNNINTFHTGKIVGGNAETVSAANSNVIALYNFDEDFSDSSGNDFNLNSKGNVILTPDKGVKFSALGDELTTSIPDSLIMPGDQPSPIILEAKFYINNLLSYSIDNYPMISFFQEWDTNIRMQSQKWGTSIPWIGSGNNWYFAEGNQDNVNQWNNEFGYGKWHYLKLKFDKGIFYAYINNKLVGSGNLDLHYSRTNDWVLTLGNFEGYIDEVKISKGESNNIPEETTTTTLFINQTTTTTLPLNFTVPQNATNSTEPIQNQTETKPVEEEPSPITPVQPPTQIITDVIYPETIYNDQEYVFDAVINSAIKYNDLTVEWKADYNENIIINEPNKFKTKITFKDPAQYTIKISANYLNFTENKTLIIQVMQQPRCRISNLSWDKILAQEGETATLTAYGYYCDNKEALFEIYEKDINNDDFILNISSLFSNDKATASWKTAWQCDGEAIAICLAGTPEY